MQKTLITKSATETQLLAKELATTMKGGEVLLLYGDLGAGKTTFMQGFAEGFGIQHRITSPTFIIVREYQQNQKNLYHIDLYRTESDADLEGLGMREILQDKSAVVAIEWPEKLGSFLPEKRIEIRFETISENERKISFAFKAPGKLAADELATANTKK